MTKAWRRVVSICTTAAGAFVLTADARAQCANPGPDVVVGDIQSVMNYTAVGSLEALSMGTTSCDIGVQWVNWFANTNQHPVIGGNLFRYKVVNGAGRFDQVGQSWLKYAFTALSQSLCCTCTQQTDGTHLGVGCSDPYTATRNGTQSSLGPRFQINAHTGFYPSGNPPHPSGGNTGRCEVDVSDLEITGGVGAAHYYGDAQYISNDDALALNNNNNASFREIGVTLSGSAWSFNTMGSTTRFVPAIHGWKVQDPAVTLQNLTVPTENGRVILGYRTTSLGGGQYHYEYAIYNLNSDLSIGSFSVPVPVNVAVTNVGFHDVTYRGGDGVSSVNQDGTDWVGNRVGAQITWATTPFAVNANANAIHWATMYTFRFDANAAPTSGVFTLGTFKNASSFPANGEVPGQPSPGTPFCAGDGSGTFCPCTNFGSPGLGCANSENVFGAQLVVSGTTSPDTVVLSSSGQTSVGTTIFIQGDTNLGTGVPFGDGIRCAGGTLKRLYLKAAVGGSVTAPNFGGGDPNITTVSASLGDTIAPGSTRYYQTWYRDPDASFCPAPTGNAYNSSSGQIIVW